MDEKEKLPVSVKEIILSFIGILSETGWEYMGLIANKITGKIHKDMDEAKLAIDTIDVLFEKIKDKLEDKEIRDIEKLIDDLKINYVMQLNEKGDK